MKFKEFVNSTRRTWNDKEDFALNISHALLGITDEAGELAKQYKSNLAYGKELDKTNVIEEIGDYLYFFARAIDTMQFEKPDEIYTSIDEMSSREVDEVEGLETVSIVLSISHHGSNLYVAIASGDSPKIGKAIQEVVASISFLCKRIEVPFQEVLAANVRKLQTRYPEKFTEEEADNRDVETERTAIEQTDEDVSSTDS